MPTWWTKQFSSSSWLSFSRYLIHTCTRNLYIQTYIYMYVCIYIHKYLLFILFICNLLAIYRINLPKLNGYCLLNSISSITCTMQKWSVVVDFAAVVLNQLTTTTATTVIRKKLKIFLSAVHHVIHGFMLTCLVALTLTHVHFLLKYILKMLQ